MTKVGPDLILFDCDGTLVDSHAAIIAAMQQAFSEQDMTEPSSSSISHIIGMSLGDAVASLCPFVEKRAAIVASFRRHYVSGESDLQLYPGVRETLLELCKRGYWLGIVTGKSHAGLLRVLSQFQLSELFLVLRTADCCPSKPHPAMVLESMLELGVHQDQTRVVGDAVVDIQMAEAASVCALGVCFGEPIHAELMQAGAMAVVDDFPSILAHFPPLQEEQRAPTIDDLKIKADAANNCRPQI